MLSAKNQVNENSYMFSTHSFLDAKIEAQRGETIATIDAHEL